MFLMSKNVPNHIGVILDGNRRFAKKLMLKPWKGHQWGKEKVEKLLDWSVELGVKELTLYAFSLQNFNRPKEEFNYLMDMFKGAFSDLASGKKDINSLKVSFVGRRHLFSDEIQSLMSDLEESTKNNIPYKLNIAMAYGGREEIVDAVKSLVDDVKNQKISSDVEVDEELISNYLMLNSEPDMIIRTGGDHRTSNFLAWQSIYSEWFFVDKTWPEFEKEDYVKCIDEFVSRERRFGK